MMNLREVRMTAGLTQESLAQKAGVSRSTIINYEQRRRTPRIPELKKICDVLGVPVAEVLGEL